MRGTTVYTRWDFRKLQDASEYPPTKFRKAFFGRHRFLLIVSSLLWSVTSGNGMATDRSVATPESPPLVIIDPAVERLDQIVAAIDPDADVVVLSADRDGLEQVADILRSRDRLKSLHIVSHGSPGRLVLGNTELDADVVRRREAELRAWAPSFAAGADILLYGCDVARGEGAQIADLLAAETGTDVAASDDRTGSADTGGDWDLEFATGPVESASPFGPGIGSVGGISLAVPAGFSDGVVLSGLNQPVDIQTLPSGEMLVLLKPGTIILTNPLVGSPQKVTYLTIPNVDSAEEKGLLSIALDPDFANNNYFYVYYHNSTTDRARISRFLHHVDHAHAADEFVIWEDNLATASQSIGYHWGGGFGFGPDNYLYLAIGDKWDTPTDAQDPALTAGKIIRVNPGGAGSGAAQWAQGAANAHLVPQSNPFVDGAGGLRDEVWALGLRNAFRMFWDLPSGNLYIGEVGGNIQSGADASHEDIHRARTTSGGANFGWPMCEGPAADCVPSAPANFSPPIFSIQHTDARSITMGPVYRGSLFPSTYYGALFFADYTKGWLRYLTFNSSGNVSSSVPVGGFSFAGTGDLGNPVALEIGADEALYYVNIVAGTLRRISYNSGNAPPVITQASANATSSPTAPFTVNFTGAAFDPEGQALTYTWTFGDGTQATGASPSHQYTAKGSYEAVLRVADNLRTTTSDPIRITVGQAPVPTIATPADLSLFRAGDVIQVRGSATDGDGALTNNSLKWTFRFLHDDHYHPILSGLTGTACAPTGSSCRSFTIPISGHDYSGNTGYQLILDVTDSDGITASTSVTIRPDKVNLTFNSNVPGGIPFTLDGIPRNGPFVLDTLKGFHHAVSVPSTIQAGGNLYAFASWSNGPTTVSQNVTVPNSNLTLTATYTNLGPVGTGPFVQQGDGTVSIQAEDYDNSVGSGTPWSTVTPAGATGLQNQAVQSDGSGRLEYRINFNRTGTHYVYVRAFGATHKSNSAFIGLDGNWQIDYANVVPLGSWEWIGPIAINVSGTGEHKLGLSNRETGTLIDKIVILATATTPTGSGPADTPREGGGGGGGNNPPVVNITAPATGSSFNLGDTINFAGNATDTEDGILTSGLTWNSSINGNFGNTGSVSTSSLSAGVHTITASVKDSAMVTGSKSIQVTVINPGGGGGGGTGAYVQQGNGTVSMQAEDYDDSFSSGGSWSTITPAGATGPLSQAVQAGGGRLEYRINFNRTGTHYVFVRAYGATHKTNSAFIGLDGDWQANYANVVPLGSWEWIGPMAITVGSTGEHKLGLSNRETGTIVDKIVVQTTTTAPTGSGPADTPRDGGGGGGGNNPPVVNITAPASGSSFNLGDTINFTGTASDTEDGNLTSGLTWNSNINGNFGSTGSAPTSSLSAGMHTITASVSDSGSANGSDSIQVTVNDPGGGGGGTGPFVQQGNGTVSMQAEDFDSSVGSGTPWSTVTPAGATGPQSQAVQSDGSGRLEYRINFNLTGTHYVYVRAFGSTQKTNSSFIGIDGDWQANYVNVVPIGSWEWIGPLPVTVSGTGEHKLGLSNRETGTLVDKIVVLTTTTAPTGAGPADTPRAP